MKVLSYPANSKILLITDDDDNNEVGIPFASIEKVYYTNVNNIPKFQVASENTRQNQFVIKIIQGSSVILIPLGSKNTEGTDNQVINQPLWTNTLSGAKEAVKDILSWI